MPADTFTIEGAMKEKRVQFNDQVRVRHIFLLKFAHKMAGRSNSWIEHAAD